MNLPPAAKRAGLGTALPVGAAGAGGQIDGAATTVIGKLGPIGELVVAIYGNHIDQIENMIIRGFVRCLTASPPS